LSYDDGNSKITHCNVICLHTSVKVANSPFKRSKFFGHQRLTKAAREGAKGHGPLVPETLGGLMAAMGQKRTSAHPARRSAHPSIADMALNGAVGSLPSCQPRCLQPLPQIPRARPSDFLYWRAVAKFHAHRTAAAIRPCRFQVPKSAYLADDKRNASFWACPVLESA
jgi:hypothetical protein